MARRPQAETRPAGFAPFSGDLGLQDKFPEADLRVYPLRARCRIEPRPGGKVSVPQFPTDSEQPVGHFATPGTARRGMEEASAAFAAPAA